MRPATNLILLAVVLGLTGCGSGRFPVTGRVLFEDGSPLEEGQVICESQEGEVKVMARGVLARDGSFRLGTERPGDGVPPGKYHVLVSPRPRTQEEEAQHLPPIIDRKFQSYATSGIELEVKESTELPITVSKPRDRKP
jgi:hypothetical protein